MGARRRRKPRLQCHRSYAGTDEEPRANAHDQWPEPIFPGFVNEHLRTPRQLEAAAHFVRPEDLDPHVRIAADVECHLEWLRGDLELGFEQIYLHNVGRNQQEFIEVFGERVLPALS